MVSPEDSTKYKEDLPPILHNLLGKTWGNKSQFIPWSYSDPVTKSRQKNSKKKKNPLYTSTYDYIYAKFLNKMLSNRN